MRKSTHPKFLFSIIHPVKLFLLCASASTLTVPLNLVGSTIQPILIELGMPNYALPLMSIALIFIGILHPAFGNASDRCKSSLGRRRPFIIFGSILASLSLALYGLLELFDYPDNKLTIILLIAGFFPMMIGQFAVMAAATPLIFDSIPQLYKMQVGLFNMFETNLVALACLGIVTLNRYVFFLNLFLYIVTNAATVISVKETPLSQLRLIEEATEAEEDISDYGSIRSDLPRTESTSTVPNSDPISDEDEPGLPADDDETASNVGVSPQDSMMDVAEPGPSFFKEERPLVSSSRVSSAHLIDMQEVEVSSFASRTDLTRIQPDPDDEVFSVDPALSGGKKILSALKWMYTHRVTLVPEILFMLNGLGGGYFNTYYSVFISQGVYSTTDDRWDDATKEHRVHLARTVAAFLKMGQIIVAMIFAPIAHTCLKKLGTKKTLFLTHFAVFALLLFNFSLKPLEPDKLWGVFILGLFTSLNDALNRSIPSVVLAQHSAPQSLALFLGAHGLMALVYNLLSSLIPLVVVSIIPTWFHGYFYMQCVFLINAFFVLIALVCVFFFPKLKMR